MYQIENIFDIMIMYRIDKYNQVAAVKKATKNEMYLVDISENSKLSKPYFLNAYSIGRFPPFKLANL